MSARVSMTEYARQEQIALDALPVLTRCAFCDWTHSGTSIESRQQAAEHRTEAHPEIPPYKRRFTRSLGSFKQKQLRDEEWADIRDERRKRMWLLGID